MARPATKRGRGRLHELLDRVERAELDAPQLLAAEDLGRELSHGVGDEGIGDPGLEFALGAVLQQGLGRPDGRGGVGEVVREHLVGVRSAG